MEIDFLPGLTSVARHIWLAIFFFKIHFILWFGIPGYINWYSLRVLSYPTMCSWQSVHLCYYSYGSNRIAIITVIWHLYLHIHVRCSSFILWWFGSTVSGSTWQLLMPGCATGYWGLASLTCFMFEYLSEIWTPTGAWVLTCHLVAWSNFDSCVLCRNMSLIFF